jgi:hypothetical protein
MKRARSPSLIRADLRDGAGSPSLLRAELDDTMRPPAIGVPVAEYASPLVPVRVTAADAESDEATEATEATEPAEPKSRKRSQPVDLGALHGQQTGAYVRRNEYGTWHTVPGFAPDVLIVSDLGWTLTRAPGGRGFSKPFKGKQRTRGDYTVNVNGHQYFVHNLILRAFCRPRRPGETGDHHPNIDPSVTRLSNLRWATPEEQVTNRGKLKPYRNGKPIEVRRKDEPATTPWRWYPSANEADAACGVQGLRNVANPDYPDVNSCHGWVARWAAPLETQNDLPPDPDYVDAKRDPKPQDAEEWRDAYYYDQPLPRLRVSNRGRAQCRHRSGDGWGHKFTPRATRGEGYAQIAGPKLFHVAVLSTFLGLTKEHVADHIDQDKASNLLTNLRPATHSQNMLNRTLKPASERANERKKRVSARRPSWPATRPSREFESQRVAARELGVSQGDISEHLQGKQTHVGGYVFHRIVEPTPWEEDWGPM